MNHLPITSDFDCPATDAFHKSVVWMVVYTTLLLVAGVISDSGIALTVALS